MDLSGKVFSPAHSYLHNASSLVSAYGIGSSLANSQTALTNSMFSSHVLTSPAYSGSLTSLSPSHTTFNNGHSISLHSTEKPEGGGGAAAKSQIFSSPAPVFNRHKDSFPYGISGVSVPNYNYHGDVYQFTSNGYPRKSRTCSYCGKIFTRSTTRRYHEKRCPLLRAAVSSYIGEDNSVSGAAATQSQARVRELNTLSYKDQGQTLGPLVLGITRSSEPQELSTSILAKSPSGSNKCASKECLLSGYQTSVIVKQELHELKALYSMASNSINSSKKQCVSSLNNSSKIALCVSPESTDTDNYDIDANVSTGYDPGLDLSLCKSHTSNLSESVTAKSSSYLCGQFAMKTDEGLDSSQKLMSLVSSLQNNKYKIDLKDNEESENKVEKEEEKEEINCNVKGHVQWQKSEMEECHAADVETCSVSSEKKDGKIYGSHKCGICGKSFESLSKLHLHEQLHTKFKPYSCKFCGQKFARSAQKMNHEKTHNRSEVVHICAVCGTSFTRKYSLKLHMRRWHQEGPWLCRHCGKASLTQMELKMHLYSHNLPKHEKDSLLYMPDTSHSYGAAVDSGDEKDFESEGRQVVESQSEDIPAMHEMEMCPECGRDFPKGYLRYHLKSHEAQKPYSCPICAKKFGYKNNMKSHIKLHTGIKPFQCKVCGAKFTRGSTLRRHARRHGIIADSVWDLFVKPHYNKSNAGQSNNHDTIINSRPGSVSNQTHCGSSGGENGESNYLISTISTPTHGSLYPMYSGLDQQLPHVSLYSSLSASTSYLAHLPHSSVYPASSQLHPQQLDALNLSINKIATGDQHSDLSSYSNASTEYSRSRSHSLSSSDTRKYRTSDKQLSHNVGIQVHTCCRQQKCDLLAEESSNFEHPGSGIPPTTPVLSNSPSAMSLVPYIVTSPSQRPSNVDSTSPALSVSSKQDYSLETISSLIGSGRMFKCFHCECYFAEYAMYRIHSKLHINDVTHPFVCMVCGEDCHDRVYFTLHLSEHLR